MKCLLVIAAVLFLPTYGLAQQKPVANPAHDSRQTCASIKVLGSDATDVSVTSPDGNYTVCVKEDRGDPKQFLYTSVYLSHKGHLRTLRRYKDIGYTIELVWAPDSSAFAWFWTAAGAVGEFVTSAFDVKSGRFLPVDSFAVKDFHRRLRQACRHDEVDTNTYLLKWVDSSNLLIAVDARPGGLDCRRPVPEEFYEVAVRSGRIVKYFQGAEREELKQEFDGRL